MNVLSIRPLIGAYKARKGAYYVVGEKATVIAGEDINCTWKYIKKNFEDVQASGGKEHAVCIDRLWEGSGVSNIKQSKGLKKLEYQYLVWQQTWTYVSWAIYNVMHESSTTFYHILCKEAFKRWIQYI